MQYMNCITYILHMKMKIPLNACIINPTTLHNIEYEYKYESVYRIEWNFRTEPYEMSYLMGVAGGCMAAILLLVCLCIYAIKSKRCCFKGKLKEGGKTPKKKKRRRTIIGPVLIAPPVPSRPRQLKLPPWLWRLFHHPAANTTTPF